MDALGSISAASGTTTESPFAALGIHFDNTLGAVLVGFAVACIVYGILLTQMWVYFSRFPGDRWVYKALVILILILETADQVMIGHICYYYMIVNFANPIAVFQGSVTWSFIMQLLIGAITGSIVQTAFAMRVWRFSKHNYFVSGLVLLGSWAHLALAILFAYKSFALSSVFEVARLRTFGTAALGVSVVTDIFTAAALSYFLMKLRTGYKQSDTLVNSLVRYAINTGFLTSAISLTTVILYNVMPDNLIFIGVFFILSKMYAISFMATLNTRRIVRGKGTDRQGTTSHTAAAQQQDTNLFHLGTRMPSMTPLDMDGWEMAFTKESQGAEAFPMPNMPAYPYSPTRGNRYLDGRKETV